MIFLFFIYNGIIRIYIYLHLKDGNVRFTTVPSRYSCFVLFLLTSFIFICGFSVNNNWKFIRMKSQKNDVIFHILIKLRFKSTGARLLEITLTVPLICKWRHRYCHKQVDFGKSCETNWLILITIILPHFFFKSFVISAIWNQWFQFVYLIPKLRVF